MTTMERGESDIVVNEYQIAMTRSEYDAWADAGKPGDGIEFAKTHNRSAGIQGPRSIASDAAYRAARMGATAASSDVLRQLRALENVLSLKIMEIDDRLLYILRVLAVLAVLEIAIFSMILAGML